MPPEDTSKFTTPIPSNMQARDVYGLGCLIEELLKERHDGETVRKKYLCSF